MWMSSPDVITKFVEKYTNYLNNDDELQRRLKPFRTFLGGPCPYPGAGPFPPPNLAMDPTGWSRTRGYSASILDGKELIEITVPDHFTMCIGLNKGNFYARFRKGSKPCLKVEMPLDLFKELLLGYHRVIWALSDKRNKIEYISSLALSDWTTIFEVLTCAQELCESDPEVWDQIENNL